ncbi:hypothetical protein EMN47_14040 [Prolixibacteraceae bacterium JC049]|nr:hypothetical protein [Prolixibacteraceae bacterium JC049]
MKKILVGLILLTSLLSNVGIWSFFTKKIRNLEKNEEAEKINLIFNAKKLTEFEIKSEGTPLNEDLVLFDIDKKKYTLKDCIKKEVLIFRVSKIHCNACIIEQFEILNKLNRDIVVLTDFETHRRFRFFCQANNIKSRIFNCQSNLNLKINKLGKPFFFILKDDLSCHHFFVPFAGHPFLTKKYIENISMKRKYER